MTTQATAEELTSYQYKLSRTRRELQKMQGKLQRTNPSIPGIVPRSARVPGVCFFFVDLMNGVPPIVRHYAEHTGCLCELLVFITIRTLPVTSVLPDTSQTYL
jgi:KUP system potassium uptake protein